MIKLRAYLFSFIFMFGTLLWCIIMSPIMLVPSKKIVLWVPHIWSKVSMWLLKVIVGLKYELKGLENIPNKPCIMACKHQSAFETCVFHAIFPRTAYVFKKSLGMIPFVGWFMHAAGSISVDRGSGAAAMRSILDGTKKRSSQGFNIVIFPEGTRTKVGEKTTYNPGISFLYNNLPDVPVIPVAINSGLFWPRYSFLKLPGKITIEFLPAMESGLSKREFVNKLADNIESVTAKLVDEGKKTLPEKYR